LTPPAFHILLLARPGYQCNGIEVILRSFDRVTLQTIDSMEQAVHLPEKPALDLILVLPRGIEKQFILDICDHFFHGDYRRVVFILEPYIDQIEKGSFPESQVCEIDSYTRLRQMIEVRIQARSCRLDGDRSPKEAQECS
jgi:hypothetical protein